MKRLFFLFCLSLLAFVSVKAQYKTGQYLYCIKDGIILRTGPGINYSAVTDNYEHKSIITLIEGFGYSSFDGGEEISNSDGCELINWSLKYLGKRQNGFLYVEGEVDGDIFENQVYKGWVPEKFIKIACIRCRGFGAEPDSDGNVYPVYGDDFVKCTKCHGRGY